MPWIESHTVLIRHRKLLYLADILKESPVKILGHLHCLWHSALEQQENGDLGQWTDELIAKMMCYDGNPSDLVAALNESGWLDGKKIHNWNKYAGRYLTNKYRTSNPAKLETIIHNAMPIVTKKFQTEMPNELRKLIKKENK